MNTRRHFSGWRLTLVCGVGLAALLGAGLAASEETKTATQTSMRSIFLTLSNAYIYSLDATAFEAPENHEKILEMLESLDTNAHDLDSHGVGLDPSFDYLKRSLVRDADDALQRFKTGNYVGSRFVLSKITDNCVTCHTKLPARQQFDLGSKFVEIEDVKSLSPYSRATLETATRQFNRAMDTYEGILASPNMRPNDLQLFNVFENYFKISIGALSNTQRPLGTLLEFAQRPNLPKGLRDDLQSWVRQLDALRLDELDGDKLGNAKTIIESAVKETSSKSDRSELVNFIVAISLLHRYLVEGPEDDLDVAQTYYLLGVAESYVAYSYWISEVDFLLEKAIRQAPKSDVAKQALAFLEEYTYSEYRVIQARAVPEDLVTNLEELRELVGSD